MARGRPPPGAGASPADACATLETGGAGGERRVRSRVGARAARGWRHRAPHTPGPRVSRPRPGAAPAARRAARIGLGFSLGCSGRADALPHEKLAS
eukprot:3564050-Prymnesium_polylepis.1